MTPILWVIYTYVGFIGLTALLWLCYLVVMAMQAARDAGRIHPDIYKTCEVVATTFLVYDVLYNVVIGSLFFLKYPQDWTLTYRLIRYKKEGGWRGKVASYICKVLLDPFAPDGCHCRTQ